MYRNQPGANMTNTELTLLSTLTGLCRVERARLTALGMDRVDISDAMDHFEWATEKALRAG